MLGLRYAPAKYRPWPLPGPADDPFGRRNRFFENFTSEVQATAVGCAVATSAINALTDWRCQILPVDLARATPGPTALRALLAVMAVNDDLGPFFAPSLEVFLNDLDEARAGLDLYLDCCVELGAKRAGSLFADRLQRQWRPVCLQAKAVVGETDAALPITLPELYAQNSRIVESLLTGAANGLRPCLDEHGRIFDPPLPQKRRWPRRTILQNCKVFHGTTIQNAFVRDASAGGLGLDKVHGLHRGDTVSIELSSGRVLRGQIAWAASGSAGLRFDIALPAVDPLIAI